MGVAVVGEWAEGVGGAVCGSRWKEELALLAGQLPSGAAMSRLLPPHTGRRGGDGSSGRDPDCCGNLLPPRTHVSALLPTPLLPLSVCRWMRQARRQRQSLR